MVKEIIIHLFIIRMNNTIKLLIATAAMQVSAEDKCLDGEWRTTPTESNPTGSNRIGNCSTLATCENKADTNTDAEKRDNSMCAANETCTNYMEGPDEKT